MAAHDDDVSPGSSDAANRDLGAASRGRQRYDVYLLNDRGGIYALGFPVVPRLDHLVNLAEITVLAGARMPPAAAGYGAASVR